MDSKRIYNSTYIRPLYELYKYKFRNCQYDVIICLDNNKLKKYLNGKQENNNPKAVIPVNFAGLPCVSPVCGPHHFGGNN